MPDAGFFIINNLAAGVRGGYVYNKSTYSYNDISTVHYRTHAISASPFVRYYFFPATQRLNLLADASYSWNWFTNKASGSTSTDRAESYSFAAGPVLFLSPTAALELTLSYTHLPKDYTYKNDIGVNVGFQIHLGKAKAKKS